jgi:diadenosine tetraphosphate (Ap4A) HIT family hydrolase
MNCCDIWNLFDEQNNLIKDYKFWKLLIRNRNATLGNCVAILKRHIEALSEITHEEMAEFVTLVKDIEKSLKTSFSYDKINYLMLMMMDKHVHFHIIPRYAGKRSFAGLEWVDEGWPVNVIVENTKIPTVEQGILNKIKEIVIDNLK